MCNAVADCLVTGYERLIDELELPDPDDRHVLAAALSAHELLSMLPISNAELAVILRGRVENVVRGLIERGFPIVEFSGNAKSDYSVITKLLAK